MQRKWWIQHIFIIFYQNFHENVDKPFRKMFWEKYFNIFLFCFFLLKAGGPRSAPGWRAHALAAVGEDWPVPHACVELWRPTNLWGGAPAQAAYREAGRGSPECRRHDYGGAGPLGGDRGGVAWWNSVNWWRLMAALGNWQLQRARHQGGRNGGWED